MGWFGWLRIKTAKNIEQIAGAEREANAGDIFLDEFLRVEANDFAAGIYQWATGISWIDGGVGLNPGARASGGKFAYGADDAFGDAEEHGVAGTADGENGFALLDGGGFGQRDERRDEIGRRRIDFDEGDVEIGVDVDDFGVELDAARKNCEERCFAAGDVGVGGDDAGVGDEEAGAGMVESF